MVIVDGFGVSDRIDGNAVRNAFTPNYDDLRSRFPSAELSADGPSVGLPDGAAGNSEIGHMNIGAGRIVKSDAARIAESIENGSFFDNEILKSALEKAVSGGCGLHLVGLLSDGEIHSSTETLYALLRMAKRIGVKRAFVHGILDGCDVRERTADIYVEALEVKMADIGLGKIATLCGRFFAMDSGENWERTAKVFTMLVLAEGERFLDAQTAVRGSFLRGISDEFIAPIVIEESSGVPVAIVKDSDVVVFFNHRGDAMKQIVRSLGIPDIGKPAIDIVCLTEYEKSFRLPVAFPAETGVSTFASVLHENQISNYRICDADRFPHVTKIFNCGTDSGGQYEQHILLPALKANDRQAEPEMTSFKITDALLQALDSNSAGVFVACLPAPELMAESGNYEKTIEAIQYVDTCLGGIMEKVREIGGIAVVTSSHGNCEQMLDEITGEVNELATTNKVPFHLIDESSDAQLRTEGSLRDVAPTLLALAGLEIPDDMTGRDLRD